MLISRPFRRGQKENKENEIEREKETKEKKQKKVKNKEKDKAKETKEKAYLPFLSHARAYAGGYAWQAAILVNFFEFLAKFIFYLQNNINFVTNWKKIGAIICV